LAGRCGWADPTRNGDGDRTVDGPADRTELAGHRCGGADEGERVLCPFG
jgi:hypothetical protein